MFTDSKLVAAGNIFDISRYGKKIWYGSLPESRVIAGDRKKKMEGSRSDASYFRAKADLKRQINANAWQWFDDKGKVFIPIFITLTFAENITEVEKANYEFTKFIQRFNYEIIHKKSYLKYTVVIEFQERGAVHYHVVFYNLPFIKNLKNKLLKIWGCGFTNYRKIKNVKDVGNYMSKYMTKHINDARLYGKKCYFPSRGLKKPIVKNDQNAVDFVLNFLPESAIVYDKTFPHKQCDSIHFTRYDLTNEQELIKSLLAFLK